MDLPSYYPLMCMSKNKEIYKIWDLKDEFLPWNC